MRILNVTQSYAPFFEFGGPPVKVKALAEGLARMGHQVSVLTADWGIAKRIQGTQESGETEDSPFGKRQIVEGVTAVYLPNWLHYRSLTWNPALGRFLRARLSSFDVVHIYGLYDLLGPRVAAECRKRRIPYVVEPIGMYRPIVRNLFLKRLYHGLWGAAMLAGAARIVSTADQETEEFVSGGIPREKIVLRRNGVEVPQQLPERGLFLKRVGLPPDTRIILFLGRLSQKKSPEMLLRAFSRMRQKLVDTSKPLHLVYVGPDEDNMQAMLAQVAAQLGTANRVHFVGPLNTTEKWTAYRDAMLFVLPSQNENFGNTAAESIAVGTPVIVTDQCGIAPLVGAAGVVIRHSEGELTRSMEELLQDRELYGKLREACSSMAHRLSWEQPLLEMDTLYKLLAKCQTSVETARK